MPKGYIQVWSTMNDNSTDTGIGQLLSWNFEKAGVKYNKVSKITCCGDTSPVWSASKIVQDHSTNNPQDFRSEVYYLIGAPLINSGLDWLPYDDSNGKAVIWKIDNSPESGCPYAQSFMIDFTVAEIPLLNTFYAEILDFNWDEEGMTAQLAVSKKREDLKKLGSDEQVILSARFESQLECKNKNTFTVKTATRTYPGGKPDQKMT